MVHPEDSDTSGVIQQQLSRFQAFYRPKIVQVLKAAVECSQYSVDYILSDLSDERYFLFFFFLQGLSFGDLSLSALASRLASNYEDFLATSGSDLLAGVMMHYHLNRELVYKAISQLDSTNLSKIVDVPNSIVDCLSEYSQIQDEAVPFKPKNVSELEILECSVFKSLSKKIAVNLSEVLGTAIQFSLGLLNYTPKCTLHLLWGSHNSFWESKKFFISLLWGLINEDTMLSVTALDQFIDAQAQENFDTNDLISWILCDFKIALDDMDKAFKYLSKLRDSSLVAVPGELYDVFTTLWEDLFEERRVLPTPSKIILGGEVQTMASDLKTPLIIEISDDEDDDKSKLKALMHEIKKKGSENQEEIIDNYAFKSTTQLLVKHAVRLLSKNCKEKSQRVLSANFSEKRRIIAEKCVAKFQNVPKVSPSKSSANVLEKGVLSSLNEKKSMPEVESSTLRNMNIENTLEQRVAQQRHTDGMSKLRPESQISSEMRVCFQSTSVALEQQRQKEMAKQKAIQKFSPQGNISLLRTAEESSMQQQLQKISEENSIDQMIMDPQSTPEKEQPDGITEQCRKNTFLLEMSLRSNLEDEATLNKESKKLPNQIVKKQSCSPVNINLRSTTEKEQLKETTEHTSQPLKMNLRSSNEEEVIQNQHPKKMSKQELKGKCNSRISPVIQNMVDLTRSMDHKLQQQLTPKKQTSQSPQKRKSKELQEQSELNESVKRQIIKHSPKKVSDQHQQPSTLIHSSNGPNEEPTNQQQSVLTTGVAEKHTTLIQSPKKQKRELPSAKVQQQKVLARATEQDTLIQPPKRKKKDTGKQQKKVLGTEEVREQQSSNKQLPKRTKKNLSTEVIEEQSTSKQQKNTSSSKQQCIINDVPKQKQQCNSNEAINQENQKSSTNKGVSDPLSRPTRKSMKRGPDESIEDVIDKDSPMKKEKRRKRPKREEVDPMELANSVKWKRDMLHYAIVGGYEKAALKIVSHPKYEVNLGDSKGQTPLHLASKLGWIDLVETLVDIRNANIYALTESKRSVMHCAVEGGSVDVVRYLAQKGVSINSEDEHGVTPLDLALELGPKSKISRFLKSELGLNNKSSIKKKKTK